MNSNHKLKPRIIYGIVFILLVMVEVLIALYVNDSFIRPYGGDIIVIGVLYCFVRIFFPERLFWLPAYLFIFAVCVEAAQAVDYVTLLGLGDSQFFRVWMGTSFSWYDILCYGVGSVLCFAAQFLAHKAKSK